MMFAGFILKNLSLFSARSMVAWVLEGCKTALVKETWGQGPRLGPVQ